MVAVIRTLMQRHALSLSAFVSVIVTVTRGEIVALISLILDAGQVSQWNSCN